MPMLLTLCDSHRRMQRGRSLMLPAPSMNVDFIPNLINHRVIATIHFVRDVKSLGAYISASECLCVSVCCNLRNRTLRSVIVHNNVHNNVYSPTDIDAITSLI